jgi:DNA-binding MarR family transcriptional regulator
MTDVFSEATPVSSSASSPAVKVGVDGGLSSPSRSDLIACAELFYFAYREFTRDPDEILAQYEFGRAHHRVLHFVHRNPGLKVAELLDILRITKQSLARVLKQLVDEGFIIQRAGDADRRERRLYLSAKGTRLTDKLTEVQIKRLEAALTRIGPSSASLAQQFLFAMIADEDQPHVRALLSAAREGSEQRERRP